MQAFKLPSGEESQTFATGQVCSTEVFPTINYMTSGFTEYLLANPEKYQLGMRTKLAVCYQGRMV